MTLTFYSNFFNHHQLPLCEELYREFGDGFHFVAQTPVPEDRKKFGYLDMNYGYPYVVRSYEDVEQEALAHKLALESDIVVLGDAYTKYFKERIEKTNKLTFVFSERIFKNSLIHALSPKGRKNIYKWYGQHKNKHLYLLCSGAYVCFDYFLMGAFLKKCYKFAYFPKVEKYDTNKLIAQKEPRSILWTARFIDWKHPEKALKVAQMLKKDGFDFKMRFIGNGPLENEMKKLSVSYGLENNVEFLGSMSPNEVRSYMEKSQIFLFTSDKGEGWGAVLNESMNSGCAVVADKHIGAVPFLIENNKNGIIYNGSVKELYKKTKFLLENPEQCTDFGKNAYEIMQKQWNAQVAAKRLLALAKAIEKSENPSLLFDNGPCSKAEILFG